MRGQATEPTPENCDPDENDPIADHLKARLSPVHDLGKLKHVFDYDIVYNRLPSHFTSIAMHDHSLINQAHSALDWPLRKVWIFKCGYLCSNFNIIAKA